MDTHMTSAGLFWEEEISSFGFGQLQTASESHSELVPKQLAKCDPLAQLKLGVNRRTPADLKGY